MLIFVFASWQTWASILAHCELRSPKLCPGEGCPALARPQWLRLCVAKLRIGLQCRVEAGAGKLVAMVE